MYSGHNNASLLPQPVLPPALVQRRVLKELTKRREKDFSGFSSRCPSPVSGALHPSRAADTAARTSHAVKEVSTPPVYFSCNAVMPSQFPSKGWHCKYYHNQ